MKEEFITYRSSRIRYCRWGKGDRILLCFHGYGEQAAGFSILETALGERFTILAIDLPFHGRTEWNEGIDFRPAQLIEIIQSIIAEVKAGPDILDGGQRWTLFGYSMGGRIALSVLESLPQQVARLVLLAPDGLTVNGWYWLATQTWLGNRLFRWTMRHPEWLFCWLRLGDKLGLVNKSIYKFARHYIDDSEVRWELYLRWTTMRAFRPSLKEISRIIGQYAIPVKICYGRFDRVIRRAGGDRFCRRQAKEATAVSVDGSGPGETPLCEVIMLPGGHRLLEPAFVASLTEAIEH